MLTGRIAARRNKPPSPGYPAMVLSVTSLGALLSGVNVSTLDVALPTVARHFHATAAQATWIVLIYMLVTTALVLAFGRLADLVGRRRLYIAGVSLFTGASLACGAAPSALALIGLRGVQAVGAAAIITNTTALLVDAFPAERLTVALGFNVSVVAAAQVLGPLVGGLVATDLGWRAVFWFNVPLGFVELAWAWTVLRPGTGPAARREPFDLTGMVLSLGALACLVIALSFGGAESWTDPVVFGAAAGAVILGPLFVWSQSRNPYPLIDSGLFADRDRALAYLSAFLLGASRFAVVLLISLYLQAARGVDAFQAGLEVFPVAAGMMVMSPVAGRLARRYSPRLLSTTGIVLVGMSLTGLAVFLTPRLSATALVVLLALAGIGSGLFLTPNTNAIMSSVPPNRRGIANGVRSMLQNTGYVLSTAVSLAIVTTPLGRIQRSAAYAGTLSRLPGASLTRLTDGYHAALALLALISFAGITASVRRRTGRAVAAVVVDAEGDPAAISDAAVGWAQAKS